MRKYHKISYLMERYSITRQGVIKFLQKNLEKINADSQHAQKKNGEWVFDDDAISIMDKLRDTGNITIVEENREIIEELSLENKQLKEKLIELYEKLSINQNKLELIQSELIKAQKQLIATEITLNETQKQLTTTEVNYNIKGQRIKELENASSKAMQLEEELNKLRKRGLLDRIFNRE